MNHKRIPSDFDECDYQVVKETPSQSETVFGYAYADCVEADAHCMRLNAELRAQGSPTNSTMRLKWGRMFQNMSKIMKDKIDEFIRKLNEKFPKTEDSWSEGFMAVPGRKFTKIARERTGIPVSAYGFIDNKTGDLFKAAGWAAPAKHARGNILDVSGIKACGQYTVAYLK